MSRDGDQTPDCAGRASAELSARLARPLPAGLYLVATPIGNLADITLRAISTLAAADVIYCEDTRHTRTLAAHYALSPPLRAYHEHNAESERPRILAALAKGRRVALVSDAGTPLVSDPGYKLVRAALDAGHRVESLPGASASLCALTVSGLPTDAFLFAGFLPARSAARRSRLLELAAVPATLVFYEAPTRLAETLSDLAAVLGDRPAAVARELTKLHEETVRAPLSELAASFAARDVKGEVAIVVGPPLATAATDADIEARLGDALQTMTLRDAARVVAEALALPRGRVYDVGLKMKARHP